MIPHHIPRRPILAHQKPPYRFPITTTTIVIIVCRTIRNTAPNIRRSLPYQLRKMACLFAKPRRRGVFVFVAFDGPGVDCGCDVCVAFGEVFAIGAALYDNLAVSHRSS